jgi:hypothetical protein
VSRCRSGGRTRTEAAGESSGSGSKSAVGWDMLHPAAWIINSSNRKALLGRAGAPGAATLWRALLETDLSLEEELLNIYR